MLLEFKHRHWDRSVVPPLYKALQWPFLPRRGPFTASTLCQEASVSVGCAVPPPPRLGPRSRRSGAACSRAHWLCWGRPCTGSAGTAGHRSGRVESETHDFDSLFLIQAVHVNIKVCSLCVVLCRDGVFFRMNVASDSPAFSHMGLTHFDKN